MGLVALRGRDILGHNDSRVKAWTTARWSSTRRGC